MSECEGAWTVRPWQRHDKHIEIVGPGTLMLILDHDDVDLDEVEAELPRIVAALNWAWPT